MGYARYVGRVGALAVALGVGIAVGSSAGVVWAEEGDSPAADSSVDSGAPAGADSPGPSDPADSTSGDPDPQEEESDEDEPEEEDVEQDVGEPEEEAEEPDVGEPEEEAGEQAVDEQLDTTGGGELPEPSGSGSYGSVSGQSAAGAGSAPQTSVSVTEIDASGEQPESSVTVGAPVEEANAALITLDPPVTPPEPEPEPVSTPIVVEVLSDILAPLGGPTPDGPVDAPADWVLAAAARRELGVDTAQVSTSGDTGAVFNSLMVTTATDPDLGVIIIDPLTGVVSGTIVAPGDPAGTNRKPSYTVTVPPGAGQGTFTINKATGAFTYTPTAAQRVLAGVSANPEDAIAVTVTATYGTTKVTVVLDVPVDPVSSQQIGAVIDTGGVGTNGVAVTNDRAYVSNLRTGTITVIDTIHGQVIGEFAVADATALAVTPDGKRLYVASAPQSSSGTVRVIDTATGAQIGAPIAVGLVPVGMAISPDGKTVYVVNGFSNTVSRISTTTNKVTGTITNVGASPIGIVVSPDGKKIYVSSADGVSVVASTATKGVQIAAIGGQSVATAVPSVALSPDGMRLYVPRQDGAIKVIETTKYALVGTFTVASAAMLTDVVVSKDGTLLYVQDGGTGKVSILDARTGASIASVATTPAIAGALPSLATSTDGQQLYVISGSGMHTVSLVPVNEFPVVGVLPVPGAPVAATGAVTGGYGVSDPDGDKLSYVVKAGPAKGKVVLNANGTWTYTPTAAARHEASAAAGLTDSFVVTVSDGRRGIVEQIVTVDISPTNKAPVIKQSVGSPNATTGNVSVTVSATDADRDVLTFTGTDPAHGTVSGVNGKYVYTPTAAARHAAATVSGAKTDSFTVTVDDGHGSVQTVSVTVKISPKNIAPNSSGSIGLPNNGSGVVSGSITPNDGDNDTVSYTHTNTVKGALQINADGTFTYTPTAAAQAAVRTGGTAAKTEKFTVTINDGHGGTDTVTLTAQILAAGDHAPQGGVASIPTPPSASTGAVAGKIVGVTDADIGDKLTYSGTATTARGKVTVTSTGGFTYTPTAAARHAAAAEGVDPALTKDTFVVTVQDGVGGSTTVTVQVDILGKNAVPTGKATVGKPNTSTGVVAVTVSGTDADKDPLSFTAPPATAKGAIVDNGNGKFTYTPTEAARSAAAVTGAPAAAKTDTFTVTIDDGFGGQRSVVVTVSIAPANDNVAPTGGTFIPTGQPNAATGAVTGTVSADDANGDALTYVKKTNPGKGTVTVSSAGVVTYTPTAAARHAASADTATLAVKQDFFQVTASDGRGGTVTFTVTVDISPKNTAPVGKFTATAANTSTGVVTGKVTATDVDKDTVALTGPASGLSAKGGTVVFNAATGNYTYTPTDDARAAAAAAGAPASAKTDSFTITLNDAHSPNGTSTLNVNVNIAPAQAGQTSSTPGLPLGDIIVGKNGTLYQLTQPGNDPTNTAVRVSVLDSTGRVIATTSLTHPVSPGAFPVVRPDGSLIVVSQFGTVAHVSVVNSSGVVTTVTPVGGIAGYIFSGVQVSSTDGAAYVKVSDSPNPMGPTTGYTIVRISSANALQTYHVADSVDGTPLVLPDGRAYAIDRNANRILVINAAGTASYKDITGVPAGPLTVASDGTVYVASNTTLYTFSSSGAPNERELGGAAIGSMAVGPAGTVYQMIQGASANTSAIAKFTSTGAVTTTPIAALPVPASTGPSSGGLGVASDGTVYVAVVDQAGTYGVATWRPNSATADIRPVDGVIVNRPYAYPYSLGDVNITVGPDNKAYVAVIDAQGRYSVYVFGSTGDPIITLMPSGSAIGTGVVFGKNNAAYQVVQRMTPSGAGESAVVVLASGATSEWVAGTQGPYGDPVFGSDGRGYLVTFDVDFTTPEFPTTGRVLVFNPDGTTKALLTGSDIVNPGIEPGAGYPRPRWVTLASDGTAYVTFADVSGIFQGDVGSEVWKIPPTGAPIKLLDADDALASAVTVAPNGKAYFAVGKKVGGKWVSTVQVINNPSTM